MSEHCTYVTDSLILQYQRIKIVIVSLFEDGISYVGNLFLFVFVKGCLEVTIRAAKLLSIEWDLIRLGGPAQRMVTKTQNSARGGGFGGRGIEGVRFLVPFDSPVAKTLATSLLYLMGLVSLS